MSLPPQSLKLYVLLSCPWFDKYGFGRSDDTVVVGASKRAL